MGAPRAHTRKPGSGRARSVAGGARLEGAHHGRTVWEAVSSFSQRMPCFLEALTLEEYFLALMGTAKRCKSASLDFHGFFPVCSWKRNLHEYGTPPADVKGFPKFTTQISILAFVPPSKVASPWDALALPPGWRCNKNHDDDEHHHDDDEHVRRKENSS